MLDSDVRVNLIMHAGGDHMVVAAAKVSTNGIEAQKFAEIENAEGNAGLINYLVKQRHGTPFEHALMTFFVHAPIMVFREFHRHRIGFSYNEESGRYKQLSPLFWSPRDDRPLSKTQKYKAARPTFQLGTPEQHEMIDEHDALYDLLYAAYEAEIEAGIGNEVARRLLPLATYSSCWVTCNPRSLMHFLSLRVHDPDATFVSYPQKEIEEVANLMEKTFADLWPLSHASFVKNGRVAP